MLVSDDPALLEKARGLREYDEGETLDPAAFNRKMTDLQAAMGLAQVARFRSFLERRAAIASVYREALGSLGLEMPSIPTGRSHVFYRFVIRLRGTVPVTDGLLDRFERRGVQCRRPVFRPLHRYLGLEGYPEADDASNRALSVPIYPSMTDEEVDRVIATLREELA